MNILDEIKKICEENHLIYYLAYGSLLGAVRHKGYIPWDDDMDIALAREDYEKLLSILKARKDSCFEVLDDSSEDYFYPFAKVVDNRTEVKMDRHKKTHGLWIDVFPIDGLGNSLSFAKAFIYFCSFLRVVALAITTDFKSKTLSKGTLFYKRICYMLACLIGKKRFCRFVEKIFHRYKIENSKYVGILFSSHLTDAIMDKEKLLQAELYDFESRKYSGYKNYDYYLSRLYGDYMKLPSEEKRVTHDFQAWWR